MITSLQAQKTCKFCRNKFVVYHTNYGKRYFCSHKSKKYQQSKYCSSSCARKFDKTWERNSPFLKKTYIAGKGKYAPRWKGGINPINRVERKKFRETIQKLVLQRDDYTCQICGIRGVNLQVDHIQSWAEYVDLRFSMDNCRTLCVKCHYKITFGKEMPKEIKTWGRNFKSKELIYG